MKLYKFNPDTFAYEGEKEAMLSELDTKIAGREIYFGEADAVWDAPTFQEGYTPYWEQDKWVLKPNPTLAEVQGEKIAELKTARDKAEVEPINNFDVDETSLMRINIAISALDEAGEGATLEWTLADNSVQTVTANDLRAVLVALAVHSNAVHEKYRELKEQVEAAKTAEEVEGIQW